MPGHQNCRFEFMIYYHAFMTELYELHFYKPCYGENLDYKEHFHPYLHH